MIILFIALFICGISFIFLCLRKKSSKKGGEIANENNNTQPTIALEICD